VVAWSHLAAKFNVNSEGQGGPRTNNVSAFTIKAARRINHCGSNRDGVLRGKKTGGSVSYA